MLGNFSLWEIPLLLGSLFVLVVLPAALVVWVVRTLIRSRRRERELEQRLDALDGVEGRQHTR